MRTTQQALQKLATRFDEGDLLPAIVQTIENINQGIPETREPSQDLSFEDLEKYAIDILENILQKAKP